MTVAVYANTFGLIKTLRKLGYHNLADELEKPRPNIYTALQCDLDKYDRLYGKAWKVIDELKDQEMED